MLLVNDSQTQRNLTESQVRELCWVRKTYLIMGTKLSSLIESLKYSKINFELSVIHSFWYQSFIHLMI